MPSTRRNGACASWRIPASMLVGALFTAEAAATELRPTDAFTSLFEQTCVQHRDAPQALEQQLAQWKASVLPAPEAKRLLGDSEGSAWTVQRQDLRYAVALRRDGACSVSAQRVDAKAVQRNFPLLALDSPPPLVARRIDDTAAAAQPRSGSSVVYAWTAPGVAVAWRLTLTWSTDRTQEKQATASLQRVSTTP